MVVHFSAPNKTAGKLKAANVVLSGAPLFSASALERAVKPLGSLDEAQDHDEHDCANGCNDNCAEEASTHGHTKEAKQKASKQCAYHTHDDVPDDAEAAALHELPR
jgi:hypothetical protein